MKILYISRNDGTDGRIAKTCNSLHRMGHQVTFVGWNRTPGENRGILLDPGIDTRIYACESAFGRLSPKGWLPFYKHVVASLWNVRPQVVHCSNEWPAIMVGPYKHLLFNHLVVDVFDSIIARRFSSPIVRASARLMRNSSYILSDRIIETGPELQAMLGRFIRKSVVIMNSPADPGDHIAHQYPVTPEVSISVGGTLGSRRAGLETLLKAVDLLPLGEVRIKASGWLVDEYAKEVFVKHPAVDYRWLDSPEQFLKEAAACDAVYYLREDAADTEYRSWVMPNRLFDAISVGRPIIVSSAHKISRRVAEEQLGFICDPGDHRALAEILRSLRERRDELPAFCQRVRRMFTGQYTWPVMEERLRVLYDGLRNSKSD